MRNLLKIKKVYPFRFVKRVGKKRGFMVIEMLIAVSIMATSILAAMTISQRSINVSRQAFHATQAAFLLEEGAEVVRLLRDDDWNNISSLTAGLDYYPNFSAGAWALSETI